MHGGGGGNSSNPLQILLSVAVIVGAPFLAGALAPTLGIAAGSIGFGVLQAGIAFAGLLIVNSIFPPRLPDVSRGDAAGQPPQQYSLSGGANRARPNEPVICLLGVHRIFPDLSAREYTEYDDNSDQYLNQIFDFGIGRLTISNERIGETLLNSYEDVDTQIQANKVTLVAGNVDSISGGEFEPTGSPYVQRTTAGDTTKIAFDLTSMHFRAEDDGSLEGRETEFSIGWRRTGTSTWTNQTVSISSPDGADARNAVRRSFYSPRLTPGAYDVRVRATTVYTEDELEERITYRASAPVIRAYQDDTADFTGRNSYALRIKATGQLYGRIEQFNADVSQRIPDWNGSNWSTARATSNPASIMLWWLRGYYIDSTLRAGYGLSDNQIDFPSLQGWHTFCQSNSLECNIPIIDGRNEDDVANLIGQCGWGRLDTSTGKYGVIWENDDQPTTGVITPANIVSGSLSVNYDNENLADRINGTYLDRDSDYLENTLGRDVPQMTITGEFPITIPLEGITKGEHAAKEINRTAAAQFYHQRQITWEMLDEGRAISVGDVLQLTNGLVGNGQGGRLLSISANRRTLGLPFDVSDASGECWLWLPDNRVHSSNYTRNSSSQITLSTAMPNLPAVNNLVDYEDHPSMYRIMLFSSSSLLTKVRVTGITPTGPHRFKIVARDEIQAYYDFRTSDLTAPLLPFGGRSRLSPTGFEVTHTDFGTRYFSWNEPDARNPIGYELRYGSLGSEFGSMRPMHNGLLSGSPHESGDRPDKGDWRFGLVAVYEEGLRSPPVYALAEIRDPGRVTRFKEIEIYQVVAVTADAPERPEAEGSYDFETDTQTPPEGWLAGPEFPTYNASQVVYACTTTADSSNGLVWNADEDDWIGPFIVGDADDLNIIYMRATSQPATPAPSETIPTGWFDRVSQVPGGEGLIYISIGRRDRGGKTYTWQEPTQLEGQDGVIREFIFTISDEIDLPRSKWPSNDWTYDNPGTVDGQTWTDGASSVTEALPYLYQTSRVVPATVMDGDDVTSVWLNPVVVGVFGPTGPEGSDGIDGQGVEYIFARTASTVTAIPNNQLPSNAWAYDSPETVNDLQWTDGARTVTQTLPLLWRSARRVPGSPARGDAKETSWGDWSAPVIVARYSPDGADGTDGQGVEFIFARTADATLGENQGPNNAWAYDRPGTSNGLVWTDGAPTLTEELPYLWGSQRRVPGSPAGGTARASSWGNWSSPTIVGRYATDGSPGTAGADGDDGSGIEFIFARTTGSTPSSPSNSWGFDQPSSPWSDGAPNLSPGDVLWIAQRRLVGFPSVGDAVAANWSSPRRISRDAIDGVDGSDGGPGPRGPPGGPGPPGPGANVNLSPYFNELRIGYDDRSSGSSCPSPDTNVEDARWSVDNSGPSGSRRGTLILERVFICTGGGGGSGRCFSSNTPVLMADGSWKEICSIKVGDKVVGRNRVNTVLAYKILLLKDQIDANLYTINGDFETTSDHLMLTKIDGIEKWKAVNHFNYKYSCGKDYEVVCDQNMNTTSIKYNGINPDEVGEIKLGDKIAFGKTEWKNVDTVERVHKPDLEQILYALVCDGDGTMQISGEKQSGYVVCAWVDENKWCNDED